MSRGAEKTRVPLLMRDRSFYHTFLILAGTLILEQAVVLSVNLADNLMIGSYNETALAAVAAGADGLLIEVHDRPAAALSDPAQSMSCTAFAQLAEKLQKVRQAIEA